MHDLDLLLVVVSISLLRNIDHPIYHHFRPSSRITTDLTYPTRHVASNVKQVLQLRRIQACIGA